VATLVAELTFDDTQLKAEGLNRVARKAIQVDKIKNSSREARNIKVIDLLDNFAETPVDEEFHKTFGRELALYYAAMNGGDTDFMLMERLFQTICRLLEEGFISKEETDVC
jgi:hypothetical protein